MYPTPKSPTSVPRVTDQHIPETTMSRLRIGVVRYASAGNRIAAALGVEPPPEVVVGARVKITFRSIGASRWAEDRQVDFALQIADVARRAMEVDSRRVIRKRARARAIVIIFEDATLRRGCSLVSRWECVVPASGDRSTTQSEL
jgi:hypothetical protein